MNSTRFAAYVFSYYGPGKVCGEFFGHALSIEEVQGAAATLMADKERDFAGDSFDRELTRDIMLRARGVERTEYNVAKYVELGAARNMASRNANAMRQFDAEFLKR